MAPDLTMQFHEIFYASITQYAIIYRIIIHTYITYDIIKTHAFFQFSFEDYIVNNQGGTLCL